jgi:phosphatidylserine/phosphatidylglycerophosphate/cardiolipin synthase-like enzyme
VPERGAGSAARRARRRWALKRALVLALLLAACRSPSGGDDDVADDDVGDDDAPTIDAGVGCEPTDPRTPATTTFVGPTGLQQRFAGFIDAAQTSLDVQMYLFTVEALADRIIAAENRGVAVRVLLDPDHEGNADVRARLQGGGVTVRNAPTRFEFSHAKYLIVDGERAVITSSNFNFGAFDSERNYGAVDEDPDDVADLQAIFDADWDGAADPELACTRLVVSPVNARTRLLALIASADETLDVAAIYMSDSTVRTAVIQAQQRGAAVRVILADPADFAENQTTGATFANQGIETRYATSFDLHAKLIVADGVAFVGSENFSPTSLGSNREVGVFVTEAAATAAITSQFDADWSATAP